MYRNIINQLNERKIRTQDIYESHLKRGASKELNDKALEHDGVIHAQGVAFFRKLDGQELSMVDKVNANRFNPSKFTNALDGEFFKLDDSTDEGYNKDFELRQAVRKATKSLNLEGQKGY